MAKQNIFLLFLQLWGLVNSFSPIGVGFSSSTNVVIKQSSFSSLISSSSALYLQFPKLEIPSWLSNTNNDNNTKNVVLSIQQKSKLNPGDKIVIFGGTGGVGQLVTKKLNNQGFAVRVAARDTKRADETLDDETVETVPLNLVVSKNDNDAMKQQQEDLQNALDGAKGVVISLGTTAFPTQKWKNGNTPQAIDKDAVIMIAEALSNIKTIQKVIIVTSVGVNRIKEMPFLFLNLFGVLDYKRDGEDAIIESSKATDDNKGFEYVVIRPGRLVGGPYTNTDVAKLLQIEGGADNGVDVARGDDLLGDCKRDALAEAVVQCLLNDECKNIDFSIISNDEAALTDAEWTEKFIELKEKKHKKYILK